MDSVIYSYYKRVSLRNFKGFKNAQVTLAPLTFLVGPNSSGKSSLFDAILLAGQTPLNFLDPLSLVPRWTGDLVDLGSYRDTVYRHNINKKIEISFDFSTNLRRFASRRKKVKPKPLIRSFDIRIVLSSSAADPVGRISNVSITDDLSKLQINLRYPFRNKSEINFEFLRQKKVLEVKTEHSQYLRSQNLLSQISNILQPYLARRYKVSKNGIKRLISFFDMDSFNDVSFETERVSSGRSAPKRWYPIEGGRIRSPYGLYEKIEPSTVDQMENEQKKQYIYRHRFRLHAKKILASLLQELNIAKEIKFSKLSAYHSALDIKDNITGIISNLIDVGYGTSQVLPVIFGCLSNMNGPLLVEQPEIHLHPKAQGVIANFLCKTSSYRQVIIETHSEHMINAARLLIAQGKLSKRQVIINYIDRNDEGSFVRSIPVLEDGDFGAEWPGGFYDERYQDTMKLLDLKSQKEQD